MTVVDTLYLVREQEMRLDAPPPRRGEEEQNGHRSTSVPLRITPASVTAGDFMGPNLEPGRLDECRFKIAREVHRDGE